MASQCPYQGEHGIDVHKKRVKKKKRARGRIAFFCNFRSPEAATFLR
jgi:hypothetical protein